MDNKSVMMHYFYDPITLKALSTVVTRAQYIRLLQDSVFGAYMYKQAREMSKNGIFPVIMTDVPWYDQEKNDCEATKEAGKNTTNHCEQEKEEEYIYGPALFDNEDCTVDQPQNYPVFTSTNNSGNEEINNQQWIGEQTINVPSSKASLGIGNQRIDAPSSFHSGELTGFKTGHRQNSAPCTFTSSNYNQQVNSQQSSRVEKTQSGTSSRKDSRMTFNVDDQSQDCYVTLDDACYSSLDEESKSSDPGSFPTVSHSAASRFTWNEENTRLLINCVNAYYKDFDNAKLNKQAWKNIHLAATSEGCTATVQQCKSKWTELEKAYKRDKDRGTGETPSPNMFFDAMDEILGHRPINSNTRTFSSLEKTTQVKTATKVPQSRIGELLKRKSTEKDEYHKTRKLTKRQKAEQREKQKAEWRQQKFEVEKQRLEIDRQKVLNDAKRNALLERYFDSIGTKE